MVKPKIPKQFLQKIALSCSGGGYRAASFHLGAMAYLNRIQFQDKPLLENVKMLSTVSGGTLTGIVYALRKQRGESFETIYNFVLQKLSSVDLLKAAITKLSPEGCWENIQKQKNLINAFAELYDQEFMEGLTFAEFNEMKSHLEMVVFNSTEFNNGINFRFRNKGPEFFGNYNMRVPQAAAQEVKLADAMAASSCFTGGFEPILWPHDFVHKDAIELIKLSKNNPPVGLMDGGIYDNQGIESILNYKKNVTEPYFDLVIISDVASPYMNPYKPFTVKEKKGFRSLSIEAVRRKVNNLNNTINVILIITILILVILPFLTKSGFGGNWITGFCLGASTAMLFILFTKAIATNLVKGFVQNQLDRVLSVIPPFFRIKLSHMQIEKLSVRRLEPLIVDRLNSLIILVMDVFLKVVRRLNYYKLYDDPDYSHRRITNLIKELTEEDFINRAERDREDRAAISIRYQQNTILKGDYSEIVGERIKEIVEEASSFGTTLWFTEQDHLENLLDKLVATGQFTMCYNLLGYLEKLIFEEGTGFEELTSEYQRELLDVYQQCKTDWLLFKEDPLMMMSNESKSKINLYIELERFSENPYLKPNSRHDSEGTTFQLDTPFKEKSRKRWKLLKNIKDFFSEKKDIRNIIKDEYNKEAPFDSLPKINKKGFGDQSKSLEDYANTADEVKITSESTTQDNTESNRFLKGYIYEGKNKLNFQTNCLKKFTNYTLTIKIGGPDKAAVIAPQSFVENIVFQERTSTSELIHLLFKPKGNNNSQPQFGQIDLPREGESTTFDFSFTTEKVDFEGEIYAYHNNRLLQRLTLLAPVREVPYCQDATIQFRMDFCIRQQLFNLSESQPFQTSLFLDSPSDRPANLLALVDNKPLEFRYNKAIEKLTEELKHIIEDSFKRSLGDFINEEDLNSEKSRLLFYRLAFKGNDLFNTLFKKNKSLKGPFQLITKQVEYVPLDFVYTRASPEPGAKICEHAKQALKDGTCGNCHPEAKESNYICPFGFWALSQVIERHHINYNYNGTGDYCLKFEPSTHRRRIPVLENTLYGASARAEANKPGLIQEVSKVIENASTSLKQASDWKQFEQLADDMDPDSIILIVHTEVNIDAQAEQLEIGDKNFLIKNHLNEALLKAVGSTKNPLAIIVGCDTANIDNYGFDITTQLMLEGVALVISNFTKIRGVHAGEIVKKLVILLKQHVGTGITMGELLLKARQQLVADGILVSLALSAQGDADWIL